MKTTEEAMYRKHFVLVHGACHGAWCWYKLTTLLTVAGHKVTAMDLAASGIHPMQLTDAMTFYDYSGPLMEIMASLPPHEKVVLVGHSLGGLNLALAMEKFPDKISAAVFLSAFIPDTTSSPSVVFDKYMETIASHSFWLDSHFSFNRGPEKPSTSMFFGPEFLSVNLYQHSPPEDYTLATTLVRVGSLFQEDLLHVPVLSKERYGSVARVYIVCDEDKAIPVNFQRWMLENDPVTEVKEIKGSDHMPMFSKPQELCNSLLEIAKAYA